MRPVAVQWRKSVPTLGYRQDLITEQDAFPAWFPPSFRRLDRVTEVDITIPSRDFLMIFINKGNGYWETAAGVSACPFKEGFHATVFD
jgi:hypothetical protein